MAKTIAGSSEDELYATAQEAAVTLRMNVRTVYRYVRDGKIPGKKVGAIVRVERSYLQSNRPSKAKT